jgi:nucleoside-diphosphate-sugar epimerase
MDYLVTGGMGFIGRHTIRELMKEKSNDIVVLDNLSLSERVDIHPRVKFVEGDVRDTDLVLSLVRECRKGVIHLAADSRVLPSLEDPTKVVDSTQTNVVGTANVLSAIACSEHDPPLVYAGSSTAYGNTPIPNDELNLPSVQSPYSATKLAGELLVQSFTVTYGIRATVLRYFQVYGPGQPTTGAYALVTGIFLRQYLAGQHLTIQGDGSQSRDFVHVTDVARANVQALDANSKGQPVNIGSGENYTIKELADLISPKQKFLPARRIDLLATRADITRARYLLGWSPKVAFKDGIQEMMGT